MKTQFPLAKIDCGSFYFKINLQRSVIEVFSGRPYTIKARYKGTIGLTDFCLIFMGCGQNNKENIIFNFHICKFELILYNPLPFPKVTKCLIDTRGFFKN